MDSFQRKRIGLLFLLPFCMISAQCGDKKARNSRHIGTLTYCTRAASLAHEDDNFGMEKNKVCLVAGSKADPAKATADSDKTPTQNTEGRLPLAPAKTPVADPATTPADPAPAAAPARPVVHETSTTPPTTGPSANPEPAATPAPSVPAQWCDPFVSNRCFSYCQAGSQSDADGDGWGYEKTPGTETWVSCKVR